MNSRKTLLVLVVGCAVLGGCATTTSPTAPVRIAPEKAVSAIPDWYIEPPTSNQDAIYVVGTASSRDLAMSVHKAQMDAETHLAGKIAGEINSLTKDYKHDVGEVFTQSTEVVSNKIAANVKIIGGVIDKKAIMPEGGGFRTYVLMRYPVGSNNQMQQIYDAKRSFRVDKEKAEAELERKTEARKATVDKLANIPTVDATNPMVVVKVTPAADAAEEN